LPSQFYFSPLYFEHVLGVLRGMQESVSVEDSGSGSGSDAESDEAAAAAEESDSSEDEVSIRVPSVWVD
jgi:hypothetical protein